MASESETFAALAEDFIERHADFSPVWATAISGDHRFDDRLDEVTADRLDEARAFYEEMQIRLRAIAIDDLSPDERVDAALLKNRLAQELWELTEFQDWTWNPVHYTSLAGASIEGLAARDFAPIEIRLANLVCRLREMPRLLERVRTALDPSRVPLIHARTAAEKNRGVTNLLDTMVKPQLDDRRVSPELRARLKTAILVAASALNRHQRWLEEELAPAAKGSFRIGRDAYDRKLQFMLQSELSSREIYLLAWTELQKVHREMYDLAVSIHKTRFPDARLDLPDHSDTEVRNGIIRAALQEAYEQTLEWDHRIKPNIEDYVTETTRFVLDNDLVTVPRSECKVIIMPEYRRGLWVAYFHPPDPQSPNQQGFYAVAPPPEDLPADRLASFRREQNQLAMQILTMHEAMPGHFLQLHHSNSHGSRLRRVLKCNSFVEGWAVYAEDMMIEAGYLHDDSNPLQGLLVKLIHRKAYLKVIANAIIDQAIHAEGMEGEDVIKFLMESAFQERVEAELKWKRARLNPVQLSTYFVGFQEHMHLRRRVEAERGRSFDLKRYNDEVLSFGSPPVCFVQALMLGEEVPYPQD